MKILNFMVVVSWVCCTGYAMSSFGKKIQAVAAGQEPPSEMGLILVFIVTCALTLVAIAKSED